jgi:hypothetical protein
MSLSYLSPTVPSRNFSCVPQVCLNVPFEVLPQKLLDCGTRRSQVFNAIRRCLITLLNVAIEPGVVLLVRVHWLVSIKSDPQRV